MAKVLGDKKTGGRIKGVPNKTSSQTKGLIQIVVSDQMESVNMLLNMLEPKERIDAIIKLLPFVIPKQSTIEIDNKEEDSFFRTVVVEIIEKKNDANNDR